MAFSNDLLQTYLSPETSAISVISRIHDENLENWESWLEGVFEKGVDPQITHKVIRLLASKVCVDIDIRSNPSKFVSYESGDSSDSENEEQGLDPKCLEKQVKLLTILCGKKGFFEGLTNQIAKWSSQLTMNTVSESEVVDMLYMTHSVCDEILDKLPYLGKDALGGLVVASLGVIASSSLGEKYPKLLEAGSRLQQRVQGIEQQFEAKKGPERKYGFTEEYENFLHNLKPPDDFRSIEIIPDIYELLHDKQPFLRPNKIKGPYKSSKDYLDIQFRLLREDFVRPLREGVHDFLQARQKSLCFGESKKASRQHDSRTRIYTGVTFKEITYDGISSKSHLFKLPEALVRKINWSKSKRLIPGNLVMLTSDNCITAIFATTEAAPFNRQKTEGESSVDARRQEIADGVLRVKVETGENLINHSSTYALFECEAYFEAYRHNLTILQTLTVNPLMERHFVKATASVSLPLYLVQRLRRESVLTGNLYCELELPISINLTFYGPLTEAEDALCETVGTDISKVLCRRTNQVLVTASHPQNWPDSEIKAGMGLNEYQYEAYKTALTSELAVIQGPPGTGKTFTGLQIVKTLLLNKWRGVPVPRSPMLILCYTNHALDQFLEHLYNEGMGMTQIVRVGGQSKSPIMNSLTLAFYRSQERSIYKELQRQLKEIIRERSCYNEDYYRRHGYHFSDSEDEEKYGENFARIRRDMLNIQPYLNREDSANSNVKNILQHLERMRHEVCNLSLPNGVINLRRLTVWHDLKMQLTSTLAEAVLDEKWLGLTNHLFTNSFINVKEIMKRWFNVDDWGTSQRIHTKHQQLKAHEKSVKHFPEFQIATGEDYDMDQLLEHRVSDYDDTSPENWYSTPVEIDREIYFDNCSIQSCKSNTAAAERTIAWLQRERLDGFPRIKSKFARDKEMAENLRKMEEAKSMKRQAQNRLELISEIFLARNEGALEFPEAEEVLWKDENDKYDLRVNGTDSTQVSQLSLRQRWAVYFKLLGIACELTKSKLPENEQELLIAKEVLQRARHIREAHLIKDFDIIGMTTTGAAKHHGLLQMIQPKIVIIEEAAEILEAHVVTSLTSSCQHLILIGDHLQLRPSTNVYQLEKKYHMNVSLFERMIMNNVKHCTLKTQHRMRSDISNLIIGPIYEELYDHDSVLTYPNVRGITKNLYFVNHSEPESTDNELRSKTNIYEANFIGALCKYLLLQGYKSEQITILATYTGQMFLLKKVIPEECRKVRITCVDNYQGEENDIILLSLVRSNSEGKVGFVGIDNRICVSLSRAKHGLYILGNMKSLVSSSKTWTEIHSKLKAGNNIGNALELKCTQHGTSAWAKDHSDFKTLVNGGCTQLCDATLTCFHKCPEVCHGDHTSYVCLEPCEKVCPRGHPCVSNCGSECPPCEVRVSQKLKCSHSEDIKCHLEPDSPAVLCTQPVDKNLPCGHTVTDACHIDANAIICVELVEKALVPCNHVQVCACKEKPDMVKCTTEVEVNFAACGHSRNMPCWQEKTAICKQTCGETMPCGHICKETCHRLEPPFKHGQCKEFCERSCKSGHKCVCTHLCHEECPPCEVKFLKGLPCNQDHKVVLPCFEDGSDIQCSVMVDVNLCCGHIKSGPCHSSKKLACNEFVVKQFPECGHTRGLICGFQEFLGCLHESCARR